MRSCSTASAMITGLIAASAVATACDKDPSKGDDITVKTSETASASMAAPAPLPMAAPSKPQLAMDDTAVFVAGQRVDAAPPDLKGRLVAFLADKPVAGETLVLNAARETKMAKVSALFAALIAAKVKGVEVHTPLRDRSDAQLAFVTNVKPSDCSAVGFIAKDSAITTWPVSGAPAERFNHGMAGPDITRGSEGLRKRMLACESSVFFVSSDESVTWGLTFDLTRAALFPEDAGLPKPRSPAVLVKTPVSGKKVDVDVLE